MQQVKSISTRSNVSRSIFHKFTLFVLLYFTLLCYCTLFILVGHKRFVNKCKYLRVNTF